MAAALILVASCGFVVILLLITSRRKSPNGLKQLPGPRGIPFVGVPHKLEPSTPFLQFHKWAKEYGPIYQTQVMGDQLVVVTSRKILNEFLMKNKNTFGNRPPFPAVPWHEKEDMVYLGLTKQAERSRYARRIGGALMSAIPRDQLISSSLRAAKDMVLALHANPNDARVQTETFSSRVTCEMVWGDSSTATAVQNSLVQWRLGKRMAPGGAIESKLPFLQHLSNVLPDFMQPWKTQELQRRAWERVFWESQKPKAIRAMEEEGIWTMAGHVARTEAQGEKMQFPGPEFMGPGVKGDTTDIIGTLALIGGVLVAVPVQNYLVAMCHHPEWQALAAAELDRVCPGRLPVLSDLPDLPTVRAIIREVNRWRPAVPLGAPHCADFEMDYEGYSIPADSNVLVPIWSLERDPELYPDADSFRPERWLEPGWPTYREPSSEFPKIRGDVEFGWGARMCLGADYSPMVYAILIGALLKTTVVSKKKDKASGKEREIPTMNFEPSTIFLQLNPWEMEVMPRSAEAMQCLEEIN